MGLDRGEDGGGAPPVSVLWWLPEWPALERCTMRREAGGFRLGGTVLAAIDGATAEIRYEVACDDDWTTRLARVELDGDGESRVLELRADPDRRWWRGGEELPDVRGLLDVDLAFSPCTNTLPIRRLSLDVGGSAEATAVWVRFPDLSVLPLAQRYTRLGARRYRYESRGGEFTAELEVDDLGLVVRYGTLWRRVAGQAIAFPGAAPGRVGTPTGRGG